MAISTGRPDYATRKAELTADPATVVFSGDGEPQNPRLIVDKLQDLLVQGKLNPDNYSLGGSVAAFESRMAEELGKEAAIWLPTGTLANHLAIRRHCGTKSRVILQEQSHIYHDEGDALSSLSGLNAVPLAENRPYFTADELQTSLKKSVGGRVLNQVGAVSIESPVRRQAGQIVPWDEMQAISQLCRDERILVHLDGARLYMMSAATGIGVTDYARLFDTVYVSTWKYFGSPFGAILAGRQEFIEGMFHDRRMFGGGLPSAYLPAALSLHGLDGFAGRFKDAFAKATDLIELVNRQQGVTIGRFEHGSNIFELRLDAGIDTGRFVETLLDFGVVVPWPNPDWPVPLLHVNTTILRRPNEQIAEAFSAAASGH